jgi:hypothetical protein
MNGVDLPISRYLPLLPGVKGTDADGGFPVVACQIDEFVLLTENRFFYNLVSVYNVDTL